MTAFPDSGHSDPADFTKMNGCFRPLAAVEERLRIRVFQGYGLWRCLPVTAPQQRLLCPGGTWRRWGGFLHAPSFCLERVPFSGFQRRYLE